MSKLLILNISGLTARLVQEYAPRLRRLSRDGVFQPMEGIFPALTLPTQASMFTGLSPARHGIVGNGWLDRRSMDVHFLRQSRRLVDGEFFYEKVVHAGRKVAKILWWFNHGSSAQFTLMPRVYYGCDGNKAFGVHGTPSGFAPRMEHDLGPFPFFHYWGPQADARCSRWIASSARQTIVQESPDLLMVSLPHLSYELQRHGPGAAEMAEFISEVDDIACGLADFAEDRGYGVMVVSGFGVNEVNRPVHINRVLRQGGFLSARRGPFGDLFDTYNCRAFALADHQIAHVYVRDNADIMAVKALLEKTPGVSTVLSGRDREEFELGHYRSGELIVLAERDSWFTWYFHIDEQDAPDYARTVDPFRKPGYDPLELFFDPDPAFPVLEMYYQILRKKLGMRYKFDVVGNDASIVKGSQGLPPEEAQDGPMILSSFQPQAERLDLLSIGEMVINYLRTR